jgi:hypothetical protein
MKKIYERPTLARRDKLSKVTAIPTDSLLLPPPKP